MIGASVGVGPGRCEGELVGIPGAGSALDTAPVDATAVERGGVRRRMKGSVIVGPHNRVVLAYDDRDCKRLIPVEGCASRGVSSVGGRRPGDNRDVHAGSRRRAAVHGILGARGRRSGGLEWGDLELVVAD